MNVSDLSPIEASLIVAAGFLILALWPLQFWLLMRWDKRRISHYIVSRRGVIRSISWRPFARGWLGQKGTRGYAVSWVDEHGNPHDAVCRTAWLAGVFFTDDPQY